MAKIRKSKTGNGYDVCTALPNKQWEIHTVSSLDDAYRVAGVEPGNPPMPVEDAEDEDISDLWELLA